MTVRNKFSAVPGADGRHVTYCRLCEAQCGLIADVADGKIVKVGPDRDHPVSSGHLCVKGPGMASITHDPDRVLRPLKRIGEPGEFTPVSWDEALSDIAARLKTVVDRDGGGAGGFYAGNPASFATLHNAYVHMFAHALGVTKMFNALHVDTGAKMLALELVFGNAVDFTFPDLEDCDFLIMLGANPMVSHMSLISEPRALHKLSEIHRRGGVVVIDPRRTETAARFEHVAIRPDSDAWLLAAMLQHVFAAGLEDRRCLEERTNGWEELREAVQAITPERAAEHCGVAAATIRNLAERFVRARTSSCYGRVGTNRGRFSTLTNLLIESLNIVAGRFGVAGGWVTGTNPMAESAGAPPAYPAYGSARSRIGDLPLLVGSTPGGTLAEEIRTPGKDQLKALFVDCGNPVSAYPDGAATAAALEQLELFVAIDLYVTETTRHAHYVLPATTFYERDDLTDAWVQNAPRPWLQYSPAVIEPLGEARLEYDIYNEILDRMGMPNVFAQLAGQDNPRPQLMEVADIIFRAGPYGDKFGADPEGLSIGRLRDEFPHGIRVAESVDAARSWSRVHTEDGRARLWHEVTGNEFARLLAEAPVDRDTLLLFGRRKMGSLNSWMHNVERLVRSEQPTLLMHPDDARDRQIANGQTVRIASRTASLHVEVEVSDEVVTGSVNYPHGWGNRGGWHLAAGLPGANINLLASARPADWEQVSGMVHVDGIPVTVLPI